MRKHSTGDAPDTLPYRSWLKPYRYVLRYPWRLYDSGFWDYDEGAVHGKHCAYPGLHR